MSPQGKASDLASRAHGFNDTLLKAPGHAVMESTILPLTAAEDGDLQTGLLLRTKRGVRAVCAEGGRREGCGVPHYYTPGKHQVSSPPRDLTFSAQALSTSTRTALSKELMKTDSVARHGGLCLWSQH